MSITGNQPSVVDESTFSVRRTISIAASIDKVWSAVTEADKTAMQTTLAGLSEHLSQVSGALGLTVLAVAERSARRLGEGSRGPVCLAA